MSKLNAEHLAALPWCLRTRIGAETNQDTQGVLDLPWHVYCATLSGQLDAMCGYIYGGRVPETCPYNPDGEGLRAQALIAEWCAIAAAQEAEAALG